MKMLRFRFNQNYIRALSELQPETYAEISEILNLALHKFIERYGRKAVVLDIGAAGLLPYDTELIEKVTVLDLFAQPVGMQLGGNVEWRVGNILSANILQVLPVNYYDVIIMSSLLHHLCDRNNNILMHIDSCFRNCRRLLRERGTIYIFEGTCPAAIAKLQDIAYPLYSFFLAKILGFAFVRILTLKEILRSLSKAGFTAKIVLFTQPSHMAALFWRVPMVLYPVRMSVISVSL